MSKQKSQGLRSVAAVVPVLLLTCFTAACQPTPEEPVVVGKNNGVLESALAAASSAEATPYDAPDRLQMNVDGLPEGYTITIDAEVNVSGQTAWPVYAVEPADITQQQADAARLALLGDTVLYKPGEYRSREEIQRSIDSYEEELKLSEGYPNLIEAYQKILKELYIEYEQTPEDLVLEEADTELKFMEDRVQADLYGGEEIILEDGGMRYEWTDEARQNAIDAGCENIYGICWTDAGRKMEFSAGNGKYGTGLGYHVADGNLVQDPGVSYTLDEAIDKGDALLAAMGFDFTLAEANTRVKGDYTDDGDFVETGNACHELTYKRSIEGVPQDNIKSCIDQSIGEDYSSPIPWQESILISLDDYGVYGFGWDRPMNVVATENECVSLIPFNQISERVASQLKILTVWDDEGEEEKWIDSRRLEVNKLVLSYMMVAKSNDMSSYYLIPVWNVCGDLIYHYKNSYPIGQSNTWILDENFERHPWRMRFDKDTDYSILTINAIDGSVIPRHRGY